jgi:hypothetical protein
VDRERRGRFTTASAVHILPEKEREATTENRFPNKRNRGLPRYPGTDPVRAWGLLCRTEARTYEDLHGVIDGPRGRAAVVLRDEKGVRF